MNSSSQSKPSTLCTSSHILRKQYKHTSILNTVFNIKIAGVDLEFCNGGKEENVLFNEALNTFYLRLYDIRYMVKDHSDSERGNPLSPHGLFFPISSKGSFYMHHPTDRMTHTTAFVTPVMEHWLEREIAQCNGGDRWH